MGTNILPLSLENDGLLVSSMEQFTEQEIACICQFIETYIMATLGIDLPVDMERI